MYDCEEIKLPYAAQERDGKQKGRPRMIRRSGYRFADQIMRQPKKLARDRWIARWGGLW
jgi:hypothetical protein